MANGDRATSLAVVINFKEKTALDYVELSSSLFEYLDNNPVVKEFYFIFHDDAQHYHCHLILIFTKQQYFKTWINNLSELFGLNEFAVNSEKLGHRNAMLRYILHITPASKKEGKKEYDRNEIVSNVNRQLLNCFVDSKNDDNTLDAETLEMICVQCNFNPILIFEFLDTTLYNKHRNHIQLCLDNQLYITNKYYDKEDKELPF